MLLWTDLAAMAVPPRVTVLPAAPAEEPAQQAAKLAEQLAEQFVEQLAE